MSIRRKLLIGSALLLAIGQTAPTIARSGGERAVPADQVWQVARVQQLRQLTIGHGAQITGPDGKPVVMTVDGVQTPVARGTYRGRIVLTPAKPITIVGNVFGQEFRRDIWTSVSVHDGKLVPSQSVLAAAGGRVGDSSLRNGRIASVGSEFSGVMVDGNSAFSIADTTFTLRGNGSKDFIGQGAAVAARGPSTVSLNNVNIATQGVMRTAVWGGGNSTLNLRNVKIDAKDGELPAGYTFNVTGDMQEAPWILGFRGNNRAVVLVENATANIYDSHIRAQRWGALSTDATVRIRIYVFNSLIETVEQGYGTLAIGDAINSFKDSRFDVATAAMYLMGSGNGVFDHTDVKSRKFGIVSEGAFGPAGTLRIVNGSSFDTRESVIQLKGSTPEVLIDGSTLRSATGLLIEAFPNDDPFFSSALAASLPPPPPPPPGTPPPPPVFDDSRITIRGSTLAGDIVNSDSAAHGMVLKLESSQVTGAISTGSSDHAKGPGGEALSMETPQLFDLVGMVTHRLAEITGGRGLSLSLDGSSSWTVTRTSFLSRLDIANGARIVAPTGKRVALYVDGVRTPLSAGRFTGRIRIEIE